MGGSQALSRSLYSFLIPKGHEAEYYSIYEISDKGTSWLGPLFFGLALQFTGNYRVSILSLILFFFVGLIVLHTVDVKQAAREAGVGLTVDSEEAERIGLVARLVLRGFFLVCRRRFRLIRWRGDFGDFLFRHVIVHFLPAGIHLGPGGTRVAFVAILQRTPGQATASAGGLGIARRLVQLVLQLVTAGQHQHKRRCQQQGLEQMRQR